MSSSPTQEGVGAVTDPDATSPDATDPGPPPRAPRSALRMFCSTVLGLEAYVVFFAAVAAYGLRSAPTPAILAVGAGAAVLCLVAAGSLRSRAGYVLGSAIQVALLVAGLLMADLRAHLLTVAVVFGVVWVVSLRVGARIDRERAERHVAELAHWRAAGGVDGTADGDADAERGTPADTGSAGDPGGTSATEPGR